MNQYSQVTIGNCLIEPRNLTEQHKKKMIKADFRDPGKSTALAPVETLLGINGISREWRHLNKGTHEESDRAEFDRHTVNEIVTALEQCLMPLLGNAARKISLWMIKIKSANS